MSATRSPREIAVATNTLEPSVDSTYDAVAGVPKSVAGKSPTEDYATNVVLPPEGPVPGKNFKK